MVPAQNRPAGSHLPSLKRFSGRSASGSWRRVSLPLAGSKAANPSFRASITPPEVRATTVPTGWPTSITRSPPPAGSWTWSLQPMMSTQ